MIVLISAVEMDLASAHAGANLLPPNFPAVAVLAARDLPDEASIAHALADARVVILRILGGRSYFKHGFATIQAIPRERDLAVLLPTAP